MHDERLALSHLADRLDDGGVRRRRGDTDAATDATDAKATCKSSKFIPSVSHTTVSLENSPRTPHESPARTPAPRLSLSLSNSPSARALVIRRARAPRVLEPAHIPTHSARSSSPRSNAPSTPLEHRRNAHETPINDRRARAQRSTRARAFDPMARRSSPARVTVHDSLPSLDPANDAYIYDASLDPPRARHISRTTTRGRAHRRPIARRDGYGDDVNTHLFLGLARLDDDARGAARALGRRANVSARGDAGGGRHGEHRARRDEICGARARDARGRPRPRRAFCVFNGV